MIRSRLRSPVWWFVVIASLAGGALALIAPRMVGIDELHHFARAYQISEGQLVPIAPPPGSDDAGVCLPEPVRSELHGQLEQVLFAGYPSPAHVGIPCTRADGGPGRFDEIATFAWYSPVGYAPQAAVIGVGRAVGLAPLTLSLWARFAALATYIGIVAIAIRRTPTGKWAMAAVALLPLCLVEAALSESPDGFSVAMVMLVLSSALRFCSLERVSNRGFLVEAIGLSVLLGLAKPTYALAAAVYLLPLLSKPRLVRWWTAALAPVAGLGISALWQRWRQHQFVCDVRHFGVPTDPDAQLQTILTGPHRLVSAGGRGMIDLGPLWFRRLVTVHDEAYKWLDDETGLAIIVVALLCLVLVGGQRAEGETLRLRPLQRAWLLVLLGAGYLAVVAGWLIYCNPPEMRILWVPHARLFAPWLVLAAVALQPTGPRSRRLANARLPVAALLVPLGALLVLMVHWHPI